MVVRPIYPQKMHIFKVVAKILSIPAFRAISTSTLMTFGGCTLCSGAQCTHGSLSKSLKQSYAQVYTVNRLQVGFSPNFCVDYVDGDRF